MFFYRFCVSSSFFSRGFSWSHFLLLTLLGLCVFIFCLFGEGDCRQACQKKKGKEKRKRMSSLELQTSQSQDAKRSSKSCFMTLITSSFPYLCVCVYVCVYTGCFHIWSLSCVFLWAHSHALRNLFSSLPLQTPPPPPPPPPLPFPL